MGLRFASIGLCIVLLGVAVSSSGCDGCGSQHAPPGSASIAITVKGSGARACEALLTMSADATPAADFGSGAKGTLERRGNKLALAFTVTSDSGFRSPVRLTWPAGTSTTKPIELPPSPPPSCYDRSGRLMPSGTLEIQ